MSPLASSLFALGRLEGCDEILVFLHFSRNLVHSGHYCIPYLGYLVKVYALSLQFQNGFSLLLPGENYFGLAAFDFDIPIDTADGTGYGLVSVNYHHIEMADRTGAGMFALESHLLPFFAHGLGNMPAQIM